MVDCRKKWNAEDEKMEEGEEEKEPKRNTRKGTFNFKKKQLCYSTIKYEMSNSNKNKIKTNIRKKKLEMPAVLGKFRILFIVVRKGSIC